MESAANEAVQKVARRKEKTPPALHLIAAMTSVLLRVTNTQVDPPPKTNL